MRFGTGLVTLVVAVAATLAVAPGARAAGPNLAPNPGFEESVFGPVVDHEQFPEPAGIKRQPLLPVGWAVEGAAGLFDHSPNEPHTGDRAAAISAPLGTKRQYCLEQAGGCHDSPVNAAKAAARPAYEINPHWRTIDPIPVTAGECYAFGAWMKGALFTLGEGAVTGVRWVDANGLPVGRSDGPSRIRGELDGDVLPYDVYRETTVTAPEDATGAVLLLGHSDDSWISQAIFDDVHFGAC